MFWILDLMNGYVCICARLRIEKIVYCEIVNCVLCVVAEEEEIRWTRPSSPLIAPMEKMRIEKDGYKPRETRGKNGE